MAFTYRIWGMHFMSESSTFSALAIAEMLFMLFFAWIIGMSIAA